MALTLLGTPEVSPTPQLSPPVLFQMVTVHPRAVQALAVIENLPSTTTVSTQGGMAPTAWL
jgi:hypothetical protein